MQGRGGMMGCLMVGAGRLSVCALQETVGNIWRQLRRGLLLAHDRPYHREVSPVPRLRSSLSL